jgi:hypothetical protein
MPTDAKCGLLVGVGLVLAAAVLFFDKDPPPAAPPAPVAQAQTTSPAAAVEPPAGPAPSERWARAPAQPVWRRGVKQIT